MQPFGTTSTGTSRRPGRWAAVGPLVLAVVFLVALVLAANHNDVLGWVIAVIAFGWLVLATLSYIGLYKMARFGAEQVRKAQSHLASDRSVSGRGSASAGTVLVDDGHSGIRDLKLDHSFKIIEVQATVIENNVAGGDADQVRRALETIRITAHNGRGMVAADDDGRPGAAGSAGGAQDGGAKDGGDEGPIAGTLIP